MSHQLDFKLACLGVPTSFCDVVPLYRELVRDKSPRSQSEYLQQGESPPVGLEMWVPCAP